MAHYAHFHADIETPKDSPQPKTIRHPPLSLRKSGLNILVSISIASAVAAKAQNPQAMKSVPVLAHIDTGAYKTIIDSRIAKYLNLNSVGVSKSATANGTIETPNYFVDIAFLNTPLRPINNLEVGSATLSNYDLRLGADGNPSPQKQKGFGVLIGRDIMSIWNIVWHGPTSTVLISD